MVSEIELSLRSPQAYGLAGKALLQLERDRIWPTPLNYELWVHRMGDPGGPLARAIEGLLAKGESITEDMSENLAAEHLPRLKLTDEIRDAGDVLTRQLESVSAAIETAQRSSEAYGRTLAGATRELAAEHEVEHVKKLVEHLSGATRRVQRENSSLEERLSQSTQEVRILREHLEQVRRDAMTDALTSLANRKAFDECLERACAEAASSGQAVTVAMLDIDHFKRFNDTWGHQTGDQVLRYVAQVIARTGLPPRLSSRYGGEEFAILFPSEIASVALAAVDGARNEIYSRQLKRRSTNEDLGHVSVSAGIAQLQPGESALSLMERADAALYASKRGGRNCVTCAESEARAEAA